MSLAQQVILITGASTGIGAALTLALAQQYPGISLVLASRNLNKLEELADQCRRAGATVLVIPTDMSQPDQVMSLAETALQHYGRVDALVNNAGYGQMGAVELISLQGIQKQFAVNLLGPITLIRALIPNMRDQGGGRIINISSLGGRMAFPFGGLYSSSKFALEGLSDALRMELAPFNIRVSLVEPGPVKTEFFDVVKQTIQETTLDPLTTPYRAAYQKIENLEQQINERAWLPSQVAAVIIKALSDRHPRSRYVAATHGNLLLFLMTKLLPTPWVDRFWQKFYGIDLVAQDWEQTKEKHHGFSPRLGSDS